MSIVKNHLKNNFSQIPNELITDMSISAGALRVMLYLFIKPENWSVYNDDICKSIDISEQTLTKYWKELLRSGWLSREKSTDDNGKFNGGYIYHIGQKTKSIKSSDMEKVTTLYNTKELNNNKENNNTKPTTKPNPYKQFLEALKTECKYKSKLEYTKSGEEAYKTINNKELLSKAYILHQHEKREFAKRITAFMMDFVEDDYYLDSWGNLVKVEKATQW
jgi:predicted transcriptional regulator